jgi:hypothetical protein
MKHNRFLDYVPSIDKRLFRAPEPIRTEYEAIDALATDDVERITKLDARIDKSIKSRYAWIGLNAISAVTILYTGFQDPATVNDVKESIGISSQLIADTYNYVQSNFGYFTLGFAIKGLRQRGVMIRLGNTKTIF